MVIEVIVIGAGAYQISEEIEENTRLITEVQSVVKPQNFDLRSTPE